MRRMTTTLTVITILAASAIGAEAQQQKPGQPRPNRGQKEFKCPTCGNRCTGRDVFQRQQQRRQAMQNWNSPQAPMQRNRPQANAWQQYRNQPRMQQREHVRDRQQHPQKGVKPNRQQQSLRFDLDGNGQLSAAERAALKAYRAELQKEHGEKPPKQQPAE